MKRFLYSLLCTLLCVAANAQSSYDLNQPFGFATRTSRTDASDAAKYNITGGGAITYEEAKASANKIVLTSKGTTTMDTEISNAIKNYSVIIFDGSGANGTDFYLSKYISFDGLKNKTLIGVNGARLCTQFYLTSAIQSMLNNYQWTTTAGVQKTGVKAGSTSSGSNKFGNLPNGQSVEEESEYLTRKALIEYLSDNDENFRKAGVFQFKRCENFIIRNIKFVGPGPCDVGSYDLMAMTESTHFWVDHCDFTDGIDGNFDITNNSDYSTVSWCTFSYTDRAYAHMNTNLVGSSDTDGAVNSEGYYLNTTYAYNHWGNKCDQRMPMARSGKIHMLNNYYTCTNNNSSINPRKNSEFYIEGNYFADGVKKVFSQSEAKAYQWISSGSRANVIASSGVSTPSSSGTVSIPYSYNNTLLASNVPAEVGTWAGATLFQSNQAPTATVSISKTEVKQGAGVVLTAETTGYPEPTIQWYSCSNAQKANAQAIGGATNNTYSPSTTTVGGPYYYYVQVTNSEGSATSNVVSFTVVENSDVVWTFTSGDLKANTTWNGNGKNYFIANGSDEELEFYGNSSSNDKLTEYSQTIDGVTYSSYLNINSTGSASRRYLSFNAPTDKGIITIVCAEKARIVTVFDNTLSQTLTTITGVANSAAESSTITTTAGNTIMLYADNQLQLYSVIWTPVTSSDPSPTPVKADVSEEERDRNTPDGWTNVVLPDITIYKTVNITDKGALTSATDNATAIQAAIDEASSAGGGKVVVPSGTWLCGPIVMKSNVVFHLSARATLKLLPYGGTGADVAGCYPRSGTNSSGLNNYAVFMTGVSNMTNVIVEGEGETSVIDGQGTGGWWSDYKSLGTRPGLIRFGSGSAFLFRNFKMQNSPGVNLTLGQSGNAHDFTVHDVIIRNPSSEASTPSHNTDGIPVWGPNVNIYKCDISTGDDNVVCDSHAHHIHAWNIKCGDGHGMSIGSYTSDAHDIIYEDITFNGTGSGFRLKTSADRSGNDQAGTNANGAVKNIICRNATMTGCPSPIKITSWYDSDPADPATCTSSTVTPTTPEFCNILFQNITADAVDGATSWKHNSPVYMYGRPEMLIHDVTLDNVKINSKRGMFLAYVDPINFINGCNIVNETNPAQRIAVNHQANIVGTYNGSNGESNDETLFSLVNTATSNVTVEHGTEKDLSTYATITGGTAEIHNGHKDTDSDMITASGWKLGNSGGSYIKITLDSPLKEGDVLTTTGGDGGLVALSSSNADSDNISGNEFTFPSDYDDKTVIYINRGHSKPTLTSITITREAPESPDPAPIAVKPAAKKAFDFVVGRDGDINAAIAAANAWTGSGRYLIFVPDGRHKMTGNAKFTSKASYEKDGDHTYYKWDEATGNITSGLWNTSTEYTDNAMTWLQKSNVSIIGQSKDGTEIYNIPYIWGISYTSTLEIRSGYSNTYLQDFTLKNLYAGGANDKGVAVAFYDRGTNTIAKNLNAWSNQDTYTSAATRCYYETSTFAGTVDFICGSGDVWFEKCDLVINDRSGNVITAPRTKAEEKWGFVFNRNTISKADGATSVTDGNWNLGRPWKNAPASTFLYTKMNVLPKDAGWTNMSDGLTIRFHEYSSTNSSGTLLDLSKRSVTACNGATADNPVLTEVQASKYKVSNVLAGSNNWDPRALTLQTDVKNVQLNGNTLSWDANDYALCWVVFKDGVFYKDIIENSITLSETGTYTVRAANSMGGLGEESAGMEYENMPATSTVVWNFSKYTEKVSSFTTLDYSGLTLVGNNSASDDVSSSGGFHMNGTSDLTIRYIKYTPQFDGKITVYYKSNNSSANDRITAIGTEVVRGTDVATLLEDSKVLAAGYTNGSTQQTIYANLTAGTTYYLYFANGGQSIMKVEYSHSVENQNTLSATVVSTRKFGSFSSLYNVDFGTDENAAVQAYTVKVKDATSVVLTRFFGVLPAGEGVVLYAPDATKSQTFNVAASATALTIDNDMIGVPVATNVDMSTTAGHAYVVNSDALKPLSASGTIAAGKAYIRIPSSTGGAKAISMIFNDEEEVTSISNYNFFNTKPIETKIYNLQGIEVKNPIRGHIYIINNKKCIFK